MAEGASAIIAASPVTATGGVCAAPFGTTLPTDATTALANTFDKLGYVDDAGTKRTTNATDEKIKAWGGSTVKVVRTEHSVTYTLAFMESMNAKLLKRVYGEENVEITPPTASSSGKINIREKGELIPPEVYIVDMKDGAARIREVIPNGQLSVSGDAEFVHSAVIKYNVTIEALIGGIEDDEKVKYIEYIDDGVKAA